MLDPNDGIRSTSLPTGNLVEVLGHYDAGGGARSLGSQSIEEFIQYLRQQAGLDPSGLAAEILRAKAGERLARTLAAPKIALTNSPFTELNGGAVDDGAGGIRWPAGSTGRGSTIRARFNLTGSDITANAGRPVTFVSLYKVTPGFLTAFKDGSGNVTLSTVAQDVTGGVITVTAIQADTVMVEMVATLTGGESQPAQIFFVGNTTQGVAADVSARLVYSAWFPSDATGTSDVLARLAQPYPSAVGELIGVATVRRVVAGGAQPAFGDRGLLIPFGQSGAGSFLIAGIPAQGLAKDVVVRGRFLFGASLDLDPTTVLATGGATVAMASGPDVGAASWSLTKLAPGIWEGVFTYTLVGGERLFEFFLAVTGGSTARGGRGFIRLEQGTLEIVSTPLTTTANAQVARYMEQARARQALVPDFRRAVTVRADGTSIDGLTRIRDGVAAVASAAGPVERNRVYVDAGTYTDEVGIGGGTVETSTAIDPPDYIDIIGLGRPEDALILARRPANQAQQEILQALRHRFTGSVENLSFDVENLRYALHIESGNSPNRAFQTYRRLRIRHRGSTMWSSPSAIGVGQHEGNRQLFTDVHASSPYAALGMHNNVNWGRPSFTLIEDSVLHGTGVDSRSIALTSCGAGIVSRFVVRNTVLSGHVRIDTDFLAGARLSAHKANRYEYALTFRDCSPIDVIAVCTVPALTLISVPGATSAVAVSNTAAPVLFGARPDAREGWIDYAAWLCSYHAVGVLPGEADPGVSLAARLGDLRSAPLYLSVGWDGLQPVTITLDQDYRSMSNDAIVLHLNLRLAAAMGGSTGGRLFSLSAPYDGRPPVHQPDREGRGLNAGTSTILCGMALAWSDRDVRVMTAADPRTAFAGIAVNDAIPGRPVRWLKPGAWLGQAQVFFDGSPGLTTGQPFQISPSVPGALRVGSDQPLLTVRSVEPHGACLEIVDRARGGRAILDPSEYELSGADLTDLTLDDGYRLLESLVAGVRRYRNPVAFDGGASAESISLKGAVLGSQALTYLDGSEYELAGGTGGTWAHLWLDANCAIVAGITADYTGVYIAGKWIVGGPGSGIASQVLGGQTVNYIDGAEYEISGYPPGFLVLNEAFGLVLAASTGTIATPSLVSQVLGGQTVQYRDGAEYELSAYGSAYLVLDGEFRLLAPTPPSTSVAPTAPTPSSLYAVMTGPDAAGRTQVYRHNRATGAVLQLSPGGSNNSGHILTPDGDVIYTSDRANAAPGGRYWTPIAVADERPYLPLAQIACWGDSMTEQDYPQQLGAALGQPVWNFGRSGDTSRAIASRARAIDTPVRVAGDQIPASGAVAVTLIGQGNPVQKFANGDGSITGSLAGVAGTLAIVSGALSFTRAASGGAVACPAGTLFLTDFIPSNSSGAAIPNFREMIHILWLGRNNSGEKSLILAHYAAMIAQLRPYVRRFLVSPIFNSNGEPVGSAGYATVMDVNAALEAAYPDNYPRLGGLDARQYIVAQYDPAQAQDVTDRNNDVTPTSLRTDALHLNATGRSKLATGFYKPVLQARGWF